MADISKIILPDNSEYNIKDAVARQTLEEKQDILNFDNVPTENSNNPVKSEGILSAINTAVTRMSFSLNTDTGILSVTMNDPE